ncbi:response regulator [Halomicroarcula sp. GCM10025709]|uniref:response regulator n=1 Tax=Haloarcula TaxID=2237 RepID=UPI0024C43E4F|nr:response regulator [Halomicroarcula sp. YJ-61-S]
MNRGSGGPPTVLIVEDEQHLADLYTDYLAAAEYDVVTAYGGEEALERLDREPDIVLLDRRMPVVSGNEVLAEIEDRNFPCRIAMVTAVNPDFEIIDMGVDDYIVKPVTRGELIEVVERLEMISDYNEQLRQLTTKKLKRNVLQLEKTESELRESDQYHRLQSEISDIETNVDSLANELDVEEEDLRL